MELSVFFKKHHARQQITRNQGQEEHLSTLKQVRVDVF